MQKNLKITFDSRHQHSEVYQVFVISDDVNAREAAIEYLLDNTEDEVIISDLLSSVEFNSESELRDSDGSLKLDLCTKWADNSILRAEFVNQ